MNLPGISRGHEPDALEVLSRGEITLLGQHSTASNATLVSDVTHGEVTVRCVVKPVRGERPLWDFPTWTLTGREVAAFEMARHLGWPQVPPTIWREDTPVGPAMCQLWIEELHERRPVGVFDPQEIPDAWIPILRAEDGEGRPVVLAHSKDESLARMAIFDAIVNNADRKGGHVLADSTGGVWAIDHGVCFAEEPKLRTVLWGWAAERIPDSLMEDVARLEDDLVTGVDDVDRWLLPQEQVALRERVTELRETGRFPEPGGGWPAVPWPVF